MTADVVDLGEYRARRLKRDRYDRLVADLKAGVIFIHPRHAMTHGLVGLLNRRRLLNDDRISAIRHSFGWDRPRTPQDYRRDLSTLVRRQFPFGYDVADEAIAELSPMTWLRLLTTRSRPRMSRRRKRLRAAARRRRLSRGW